jgi:hypothetical protein
VSNYSGALTVVGYAVGTYFGYPQLGAVVGGVVGGAVDYSQIPDTEGPRLGDAQTISAAYGDVIPYVAGAARLGGQVWWVGARREIATEQDSGKGGGPKNTTFTYEQDVLFGLTSHQIGDVARIWLNGKLIWTQLPDASIDSVIASEETSLWSRITVYGGESTQLPDPTYEAAVGAGNAPAYRGRCSVFIESLQLGTSGQFPNLTFEVIKQGLQTMYLHMPLTANDVDIIATPASVVVTGTPSYSSDGALLDLTPGATEFFAITTPTGGKLSIDDADKRGIWSMQVDVVVIPSGAPGTGDNIRFMYSYNIGAQYGFSFQTVSGIVKLFAWVSIAFGASLQIDLGTNFRTGRYRIQYDTKADFAARTVKWYLDGELLLERLEPSASLQNVLLGLVSGDKRGVSSITIKDFKIFATGVGTLQIGEPLQDVVEELCRRSGMPAGTYDATALSTITKPVRSLVLAQLGATRAALQPLQLAYFFDCTLTDKLYFKPRATSAVATIPFDDLAAGVDKPSGEPFALTQGSDLELPAQVAIRYRNVDNDYQTGVEVSDRLLSGQVAQQSIEVAIGMTPSEAKALADAVVIDNLAGLTRGTVALSMAYAHLMPADVVLIDGQLMRLGRKQDARGVITFEARRHDSSAIISAGVTDGASYGQATEVTMPSATVLQVLDIPILRDADDGPGHYVAANGGATWAGASVQRSLNNVDFTQAVTVLERAVFGTCTTTLGNFTGIGFDEVNSLGVNVGTGELASATRDALLLDGQLNALLVGGELIRFATATLTGTAPNRYTLTRLLRGQRGTEWAMAGHVASERCVLLRPQGLRYVTTPQTDIGLSRYIKGVTVGLTSASVDGTAYTNTGVSQKPFAPVDVRVARLSQGLYRATWQRRTRLATTFADGRGVVVPLGESSEQYEVETYDSGNVLIRTASTTEPAVTIGGPGKVKQYATGIRWPTEYSGKLYGVDSATNNPVMRRMASDGSIEASSAAIPGAVWKAVYDGSGVAYVISIEVGPDGFINACKIRRITLSNLTVTATVDLFSLFSQFGYGIAWDGSALWSATITGATLRKHDATTLAVTDTEVLGNTATGAIQLVSDGAGTLFAAGKDWSKITSFNAGASSVNWTVDYVSDAAQFNSALFTGSLLFASAPGKVFAIDPSDGSIVEAHEDTQFGSLCEFDSNAAYATSVSTPLPGGIRTDPGPINVLDGTTGALLESFPLESDLSALSGTVDGKLLVVSVGTSPAIPYVSHLYGPAPDLPGGSLKIYQMSSIVGRGYPAVITI